MAKWGMWIEFFALAYGMGVIAYVLSGLVDDPRDMILKVNDKGGPMVLAPLFVGAAIGTLLTLVGRTRMMGIPPDTGAKKVFFGAWAFTVIRFLAVGGAAALILMAASEWPDITKRGADTDEKGKQAFLHMFLAFVAFAAGTPFWLLADVSTIPAMAIVGGAIPSLRLRQKAGQVTFVFQALVIAYILAIAAASFGVSQIDWKTGPRDDSTPAATAPKTGTSGGSGAQAAKPAIFFSAGLGILVQLAYTALFASMYGAGRRAVAEAHEAERSPESDED